VLCWDAGTLGRWEADNQNPKVNASKPKVDQAAKSSQQTEKSGIVHNLLA
jgi:hypothetical protein